MLLHLKAFLSASPFLGAVSGALLGVGTDLTGMVHSGNIGIFAALCGLAGAFFASLPKIIAARSQAKMSESEFIGKETRGLIDTLKKNASDSERVLALSTNLRHTVQSSYQGAVSHYQYLEMLLTEKGISFPKIEVLNVGALLKEMDREVIAIKNARPETML